VGVLLGAHTGNDLHLIKGKVIFRAGPSFKMDGARAPGPASLPTDAGTGNAQGPGYRF
jgi:hypothetical protein